MSRAVLLAAAIAGAISIIQVSPLVTLHALAVHSSARAHEGGLAWLHDPGLVLVLMLTATAAMPALGLAGAVSERLRGQRAMGDLNRGSVQRAFRGIDYRLFPGDEVLLFAAGSLRAGIYASSAARATLSPDQFHAALLHERAHCERNDLLLRQLLRGVERAFGKLPWVRNWVGAARLDVERRADEAALLAGADRRALFDAIVAASSGSSASVAPLSDGVVLPRLQALAGIQEPRTGNGWEASLAVVAWLALPPLSAHVLVWNGAAPLSL